MILELTSNVSRVKSGLLEYVVFPAPELTLGDINELRSNAVGAIESPKAKNCLIPHHRYM